MLLNEAELNDAFEKSAECEADNCDGCTMRLCDCCCHDIEDDASDSLAVFAPGFDGRN
jgi:hypothetical protein